MKAKKAAAKPAKKAAKPAPKKVVAKKPVKAAKPAKPAKTSKPVAKSKPSTVATAASKLKNLFSSKKPESKPEPKPAPAKKAAPAPAAKPAAAKAAAPAAKTFVSSIPAPKGMLTEAQIRRMSDKDYMNDTQLEFFRHRLFQMREEVLTREVDAKERLHQREVFADPADRATAEEEHYLDLRLRERESLLLRKIDEALRRISEKEFGYCEKTGDPIGIPRLLARPTATVCVDVKGQDERVEAQFRDR